LGFGREGKSVLKFLKRNPAYKKAAITILDQKLNKDYLKNLDSFDLVFRSPGVPYNLPEIKAALKKGVKFSSSTKLFFDLCQSSIIGITGTKGKGTTSTLLYQILKNWQKSVSPKQRRRILLAGNIGKPALEILPKINKRALVVLELSSFQLQDLQKSPQVAVITETFPDHMDVHKNMREYIEAKSNIARYQKKSDAIFYFKDNLLSQGIARKSSGKKIAISAPKTLEKNRILAAAVARYLGCPEKIIEKTVRNFHGLEHRLELVKKVTVRRAHHKNKSQIYFYNDSASTNPQTTAAAISYFSSKTLYPKTLPTLILIAGGKDKNLDYKPLVQAIKISPNVKEVILIGENKNKIKKALSRVKVLIVNAESLQSAVETAYKKAKTLYPKTLPTGRQAYTLNPIILFSPGAASFDMFKDYADRGNKFKEAVRGL